MCPHGLWPTRLLHPSDFPGKGTGVGRHCLLQGIFPTWGWNPDVLHRRQTLYRLSPQGSSPASIQTDREEWGPTCSYRVGISLYGVTEAGSSCELVQCACQHRGHICQGLWWEQRGLSGPDPLTATLTRTPRVLCPPGSHPARATLAVSVTKFRSSSGLCPPG